MSVPIWPSTLPAPTVSGWQEAPQDVRVMHQPDVGPIGFRRRASRSTRTVSLSLHLTRAQKAIFDRFVTQALAMGSLPFWMADPITDGWSALAQDGSALRTGDGTAVHLGARVLCLIGSEPPKFRMRGTTFNLSLTLVVLP